MHEKISPIAVFAFNRPKNLYYTLESLKRCDGINRCPLFIYCDQYSSKINDKKYVEKVRNVAKSWAAKNNATVILRKKNMHFNNIVNGITELCNKYGRIIVIEDDIIVSPDFLKFICSSLDKYNDEKRVFMVGGFMFEMKKKPLKDTFFLPNDMVWGWATWQRAWKYYDPYAVGWEELVNNHTKASMYDFNQTLPRSKLLKRVMKGKVKAWAPQWGFSMFKENGLGLYPRQSLTWNSGFGSGVHGKNKRSDKFGRKVKLIQGKLAYEDFSINRLPEGWSFPVTIDIDKEAFQLISKHWKGPLWKRYLRSLKRFLKNKKF